MSKERWVVSELEKRYGVDITRRWLANLANLGGIPVSDIDRLADLLDVLLIDPQDGDILQYEAASQRWKNKVATNGGSRSFVRVINAADTFSLVSGQPTFSVPWTEYLDYHSQMITDLPPGLGLTVDNPSGAITSTETGIWWIEIGMDMPNDSAAAGSFGMTDVDNGDGLYFPGIALSAGFVTYGAVIMLPAGKEVSVRIIPSVSPADPANVIDFVQIVLMRIL